jgi:hypothetical protein
MSVTADLTFQRVPAPTALQVRAYELLALTKCDEQPVMERIGEGPPGKGVAPFTTAPVRWLWDSGGPS